MRNLRSQEEIIALWEGDADTPTVSICCITYNHEPYIEDALNGFLIQETNFPFEILIHDDASTDRTADIIRDYEAKYPKLIKPIYQSENQYSKGIKVNPEFNYSRLRGKYIALCEGDDYWTDPKKLHKQKAIFDENNQLSLVFHPAYIEYYSENTLVKSQTTEHLAGEWPRDSFFYEGGSSAPTASMMFKAKDVCPLPNWYFESPVGDMPLKLLLADKGAVYFLPDLMLVRRLGTPGSWNDVTRTNPKKETAYLNGMIKMLRDFNQYSSYKWNNEVHQKIGSYLIRKNEIGVDQFVNVRSEFPQVFRALPWKYKLKVMLMNFANSLGVKRWN